MPTGRFVHRVAAVLAIASLLGWMGLPAEHIHVTTGHGHDIEYVHRHVDVQKRVPHDDAAAEDHDSEATYLTTQAVTLTRVELPAPDLMALAAWNVTAAMLPPTGEWRTPVLDVYVHAPPWRQLYARRGPPSLSV